MNRFTKFCLNGVTLLLVCMSAVMLFAKTPEVGQKAPDFTLNSPEGKSLALSQVLGEGDVALVFLRGYPGYQCPLLPEAGCGL